MNKLTHDALWPLEAYARKRDEFRAQVMAHKRDRQVALGDHVRLLFEDEMTIRYQIQEMLRIEKVFEPEGIQDELDAYNPLIPDGQNWKATLMIEFGDPAVRKQELAKLIGIEEAVWMKVNGFDKVHPITNEDLERSNDEKTSSVHFMRFELAPEMVQAVKAGADIYTGCNHSYYSVPAFKLRPEVRNALSEDLIAPS
ncbi:DUF3501 family protein [Saccharospirillum salsuginis]|uniref:DUF3501 family protein n=1 Tax=Saccharospirillum salsuginis TaxID=418750 RepID=A0A918KPI8_9GAMM|nr:DUF3501 family protein [Saccharospirillum salsuginis]GGX71536.1 hypothetical protein GCM10007392_43830 [Saccharospirillum salsuginis]